MADQSHSGLDGAGGHVGCLRTEGTDGSGAAAHGARAVDAELMLPVGTAEEQSQKCSERQAPRVDSSRGLPVQPGVASSGLMMGGGCVAT